MAGFVHDVQKKQHRERSQPQRRKRLGLLEKKKDYRLRAADFHKKQAQLKILKNKAKSYNEDEYYHAMTRNHTDARGILISDRDQESLTNDEVMLLKTQDTGYLTTIAQREAKKIEKELKDSSTFKSSGKHTVFVSSRDELETFDPVKYFDTDASLLYNRENRLRLRQLSGKSEDGKLNPLPIVDKIDDAEGYDKAVKDVEKLKRLTRIKERMQRKKKLQGINSRLDMQKQLMNGGNVKKIPNSDGKSTYKWKNQRKK
ncbi:hypothetical protein HII12_000649 [Brettanomyces bruxellensis]|uniref:U3 small nucleolar RNA-associated protein 11 n=1 Tax=Dekkera bruxellensis TaxID=5007 RepID=A0A8H6BPU9_DEKBR|nr:hypothetical protein HII12_000649 [Brettanomyces bruxellensis]